MLGEPGRVLPLRPFSELVPVLRSGLPAEKLAYRISHAPAILSRFRWHKDRRRGPLEARHSRGTVRCHATSRPRSYGPVDAKSWHSLAPDEYERYRIPATADGDLTDTHPYPEPVAQIAGTRRVTEA